MSIKLLIIILFFFSEVLINYFIPSNEFIIIMI